MNFCVLMASPRKQGNTNALLQPFLTELTEHRATYQVNWLYDRQIKPCIACRVCQQDWSGFGCHYQDDAAEIFQQVLAADVTILATPIYSWYCTPPLKALLDRLVYGMNKYYGDNKGPALWANKKLALITTCGYSVDKGADLFVEGIKRYCKHSQLAYLGMLAERDWGYKAAFMDETKAQHARMFAQDLLAKLGNNNF